jgi:hypothetical protein
MGGFSADRCLLPLLLLRGRKALSFDILKHPTLQQGQAPRSQLQLQPTNTSSETWRCWALKCVSGQRNGPQGV